MFNCKHTNSKLIWVGSCLDITTPFICLSLCTQYPFTQPYIYKTMNFVFFLSKLAILKCKLEDKVYARFP